MKEILFRISAMLTGIVVPVILCEIVLRMLGIGYGNAPIESDHILHHRHSSNYIFRVHTPSKEYGGHLIHYDAEGNSSDPDKIGRSPDGPTKIAVMGDSFAEATQVPYQESFVGLMEHYGRGVVKNYGVSSYSPVLFLLQWRNAVKKYATSSYVFILLFNNDVEDDESYASKAVYRNGEIVAIPGPGNDWFIRSLRQSYLLTFH